MENGERDFYFNRGADGQLSRQEVENIPLDEFSIIHFGSEQVFYPDLYRLPIKVYCKELF